MPVVGRSLGVGGTGLVECIHGTPAPSKSWWQVGVLLRAEELLTCVFSECPWFVFVLVDWYVKAGDAKWRDFRSHLASCWPRRSLAAVGSGRSPSKWPYGSPVSTGHGAKWCFPETGNVYRVLQLSTKAKTCSWESSGWACRNFWYNFGWLQVIHFDSFWLLNQNCCSFLLRSVQM